MNSIMLSLGVVVPLACTVFLGYFFRRMKLLDGTTTAQMNHLVYKCFLPVLMFLSIYGTSAEDIKDISVLKFAAGFILILYLVLMLVLPTFVKDKTKASVMVQGIYRSNFISFGTVVVSAVYGAESVGVTSMLCSIVVPLYNVLAVLTFELLRGNKLSPKKLLAEFLKNPFIIAALCGYFFLFTGIRLPDIAVSTLNNISKIATTLALMMLGAEFKFAYIGKYKKELTATVLCKLFLVPAIGYSLAIWLGYRSVVLLSLGAMFMSPVASSSYNMAEAMGGNGELAGAVVVSTSVVSVLSIFLWVLLLSSRGWI